MSALRRNEKGIVKLAKFYIDEGFTDIPEDEYRILEISGVPINRLRVIIKRLLELNKDTDRIRWLQKGDVLVRDIVGTNLYNLSPEQLEFQPGGSKYQEALTEFQGMPFADRTLPIDVISSDWQSRLRSRKPTSGAGLSSFGAPKYITVNGRKRKLYIGLYGGIYYKNKSGTKIYLKQKIKKIKNKIIKSADGISVTGWKNILNFYEKSKHKIGWVHELTRVLNIVKIGDMIEFTVKTDDSGELYTNYLEMIVSPDDDGNYPVLIDGKKYLVSGNSHDAKNTFSSIWAAPDVFNPGRNWYVYKFKTRINLTEV